MKLRIIACEVTSMIIFLWLAYINFPCALHCKASTQTTWTRGNTFCNKLISTVTAPVTSLVASTTALIVIILRIHHPLAAYYYLTLRTDSSIQRQHNLI